MTVSSMATLAVRGGRVQLLDRGGPEPLDRQPVVLGDEVDPTPLAVRVLCPEFFVLRPPPPHTHPKSTCQLECFA